MCLGYMRYSVRVSRHPRYRWISLVLFISHNCLAPPHFPESPHRAFIPQCTCSPHQSLAPCEFFLPTFFSFDICYSSVLKYRCYSCFLFPVPGSYFSLACFPCPCPCPASLAFIFFIGLCLLVFLVLILWLLLSAFVLPCALFMFGPPVVFIVVLTFWYWPSFCVLADNSLALCLFTSIYVITWNLTSACLITISALPH